MTDRINCIETLRKVSNDLGSNCLAQFKFVKFPGWDKNWDEEQEKLIRESAKAILAKDVSPDEGIFVSQKSIAALIHYIADMLEND
jgi:hypothetical protein